MKVPLKWLEDFVTIDIPVAELAERLTFAGLEVGEVIEVGADWDREKILVGEIVTGVRPSPRCRPADPRHREFRRRAPGDGDGRPEHHRRHVRGEGPVALVGANGSATPRGPRGDDHPEAGQDPRRAVRGDGLLGEGTRPLRRARGDHDPA